MISFMITLEERIAKTERLLRRLEEDRPYLRARLADLSSEHRQSATAFADRVRVEAEAELRRLHSERALLLNVAHSTPATEAPVPKSA